METFAHRRGGLDLEMSHQINGKTIARRTPRLRQKRLKRLSKCENKSEQT